MFNKIISSISTVSSTLTNHGAPQSFKFLIEDKIEIPHSPLFHLYTGKPKNGILNIPGVPVPTANEPVEISVLVFKKSTSNAHLASFALTAMRKLVSIRHPSVVRVLDSAENETGIFIATEKIVPITIWPRFKDAPIHGIYQIVKGLQFIHEEVKVVHGSLDPCNIYVASSGGSVSQGSSYVDRSSIAGTTTTSKILDKAFSSESIAEISPKWICVDSFFVCISW